MVKAKTVIKGKYEANLEFLGRWEGVQTQNPFKGREGIFSGTAHCMQVVWVVIKLFKIIIDRVMNQNPPHPSQNHNVHVSYTLNLRIDAFRCVIICQ